MKLFFQLATAVVLIASFFASIFNYIVKRDAQYLFSTIAIALSAILVILVIWK